MPAAIDRAVIVAARANGGGRLEISAPAMGAEASIALEQLVPRGDWSDYVAGVAQALIVAGVDVPGADLLIESDVPIGAGVSSSAALGVASATALLALAGSRADGVAVALWCQRAENDFVGAPTGIMDQFASANGRDGAALVLDCRSLAFETAAIPPQARFLVVDSLTPHAHASGDYRRRREECEAAARTLGVPMLRDVSEPALPEALARLPDTLARRCRHVVTENARVLAAADTLRRGDLVGLGELMNRSHASLRDDFEVSTPQVDRLVAIACATEGVYGARIMGGGFGGSIIALVGAERAEAARGEIQRDYGAERGAEPDAFVCRVVAGAREIFL